MIPVQEKSILVINYLQKSKSFEKSDICWTLLVQLREEKLF